MSAQFNKTRERGLPGLVLVFLAAVLFAAGIPRNMSIPSAPIALAGSIKQGSSNETLP
jgi:hypothetical protein